MKNAFILCLLLFIVLHARGQQGFIKNYNFNYPQAMVFNTLLLDDSELIICGHIRDSIYPYQVGVVFTKLDTSGNVINYTTYYDSLGYNYTPGEYPGGLIKLQNNTGYLFAGNIFEGSGGFLSKWDLEGNLVWFKKLEDSVSLTGFYFLLKETPTGFLVGGFKQVQSGSANLDAFLLKTDKQGNVQWEQRYGELYNADILNSIVKINNNEYLLGGLRGAGGGLPTTEIQIIAVDSVGIEKWTWESDTPEEPNAYNNIGCYGLQQDEETGNWAYATSRNEVDIDGAIRTQAKFVIRDSNFNLITEQVYDNIEGRINILYNLINLSNGGWLAMGGNSEAVEEPVIALGHVYSWMVRIDESGDSLWTRKDLVFPDTTYATEQYLHSAVELPSGSIIAAGYYHSFGTESDHGFLIKIDCQGNVDTLLTCIPLVSLTEKISSFSNLKIFPNPATDMLYFESEQVAFWDKAELLDVTGRAVKTESNTAEIKTEGLSPGMYILRLWKEGRHWIRKVVVE
jgi:Secretion system C-terminal sorting domain